MVLRRARPSAGGGCCRAACGRAWCCAVPGRCCAKPFSPPGDVSVRRGIGRVSIAAIGVLHAPRASAWPTCSYFASAVDRWLDAAGPDRAGRLGVPGAGAGPAAVQAVDSAGRPACARRPGMTWPGRALAVAVATLALSASASAQPGATLVVPFELERFDARVGWLGEGVAIGVAAALHARGVDDRVARGAARRARAAATAAGAAADTSHAREGGGAGGRVPRGVGQVSERAGHGHAIDRPA